MQKRFMALFGAVAAALAAPALAGTIANAISQTSGTVVTVDDSAVVTAVISGTATKNTYLLQDSTGGVEAFNIPFSPNPSAPVVGDIVNLTGTFSPFHSLPEIGATSSSETIVSHGNPVPADLTTTLTDMQNGSVNGPGELAQIGDLNNVTFVSPTPTFTSNESLTVTDGTLTGTVFVGSASPVLGQAIPTGPVNIHGFLSIFSSTPDAGFEYAPLSVTAVPEPTSLGLIGLGAFGLISRRRRQA